MSIWRDVINKDKAIKLDNEEEITMKMFFNLQSRYILFQVLSGNKYIEKKFFDGIIQEEFFDKANDNKICFPLDLYSAASFYDIG